MFSLAWLGQNVNNLTEIQDACGDVATRGTLCEKSYNLTNSQFVAESMDFISKPVRIIFIIVAAYLANRLVRFLIRRSVKKFHSANTNGW